MTELVHKSFLNNTFIKRFPGSPSEKGNAIRRTILVVHRRQALRVVAAKVSWTQAWHGSLLQTRGAHRAATGGPGICSSSQFCHWGLSLQDFHKVSF